MPFTEPTAAPSSPPTYSAPSHDDLAAVAATVSVVGVLMALLVTWLVIRLRRASQAQSKSIPILSRPPSTASYTFRPSFTPSEASSKFGFSMYIPQRSPRPYSLDPQLASPSVSPTDTRTTAGTLRIPTPSHIPKRSRSSLLYLYPPQNTVRHRSRPYPPTPHVHTAPAHARTNWVPAHPLPLTPPLPSTLSSHPRQHTVQIAPRGRSTSPRSFDLSYVLHLSHVMYCT